MAELRKMAQGIIRQYLAEIDVVKESVKTDAEQILSNLKLKQIIGMDRDSLERHLIALLTAFFESNEDRFKKAQNIGLRKAEKIVTYQLTLYKHFFCQKHNIDPKNVETHFALLKRTASKNRVEIFRVTSCIKKTENALKLLYQAIYNISKRQHIKNRLACLKPYPCKLYKTEHCP